MGGISGSVWTDGFVRIPKTSIDKIPDLSFIIGGATFTLNRYAQLVPQAAVAELGLDTDYYWAPVTPGLPGQGVLGVSFMQRFYAVFDTDNQRIGLAETVNTSPTSVP